MSVVPESNSYWRARSRQHLTQIAAYYAKLRTFFAEREVLEVMTPPLMPAGVSDLHIHSFTTEWLAAPPEGGAQTAQTLYLQTSPEYAMKRLLAAGSGDIFQISPAFRNGEFGPWHLPVFTMLEWYRCGFDHYQLMDEMDQLLQTVFELPVAKRFAYHELLQSVCGVDADACASEVLDQLMCDQVEPTLVSIPVAMIYDYPASQSALARIHQPNGVPVAARFEVYVYGVECGNGFYELTDPVEQRARFERDNAQRQAANLPIVPLDEAFLAALDQGLPDCAGVAVGLDRLLASHGGKLKAIMPISKVNT